MKMILCNGWLIKGWLFPASQWGDFSEKKIPSGKRINLLKFPKRSIIFQIFWLLCKVSRSRSVVINFISSWFFISKSGFNLVNLGKSNNHCNRYTEFKNDWFWKSVVLTTVVLPVAKSRSRFPPRSLAVSLQFRLHSKSVVNSVDLEDR